MHTQCVYVLEISQVTVLACVFWPIYTVVQKAMYAQHWSDSAYIAETASFACGLCPTYVNNVGGAATNVYESNMYMLIKNCCLEREV